MSEPLTSNSSARDNLDRVDVANWACSRHRLMVHFQAEAVLLSSYSHHVPSGSWMRFKRPKLQPAVAACSMNQ